MKKTKNFIDRYSMTWYHKKADAQKMSAFKSFNLEINDLKKILTSTYSCVNINKFASKSRWL